MTAPGGDPRLDPAFQRKHGIRETEGYEKAPVGKAVPLKTYTLRWKPVDDWEAKEIVIKTKALSRFLIVGVIGGRGVILFRCRKAEKAAELMRTQQRMDDWRWLRVVDQRTREVLVLEKGELVREK